METINKKKKKGKVQSNVKIGITFKEMTQENVLIFYTLLYLCTIELENIWQCVTFLDQKETLHSTRQNELTRHLKIKNKNSSKILPE